MPSKHYTCPFSNLILSGRCGCKFGAKDCIAEKEFGACLDGSSSKQCQSLYAHLRDNSDFVLNTHHQNNLSVGQQSKIKMGGLLALQEILNTENSNQIEDISNLVKIIEETYMDFKNIPFSKLMPRIAQFKFRKKP
ncbi:conserved hypothetical protein [Isorropodon fossajaponicum endosymbiont JTNG4]|uniref:hypothetical protein n=1 Tax=Isorropodon fossajaponicum symbiont TaxID=883811 RepID=UPI001916596B|nr:hypothetical protein [Isorropodon fossajaponicum symbiont]BBB24116.1 conserved hypothetical protein [Isorropodon fossajaponicum endosymbiont JTNG4]